MRTAYLILSSGASLLALGLMTELGHGNSDFIAIRNSALSFGKDLRDAFTASQQQSWPH